MTGVGHYKTDSIIKFINRNSIFHEVWDELVANGSKIQFKIDPSLVPYPGLAALQPNGSIVFSSEQNINVDALQEELIHELQLEHYSNRFTNTIRNFEFEAKVTQDLGCYITLGTCGFIASFNMSAENVSAYISWIQTTVQAGSFRIGIFNHFCSVWSYPYPPGNYCDSKFIPEVLTNLMNVVATKY